MRTFICMWDCNGIEAVREITEFEFEEDERMMEMIKTGKPQRSKLASILHPMELRARFNPQRFYEIYALQADDAIAEKDVFDMFMNSPQDSADLVRKQGVKIYSDRATKKAAII